MREELKSKAEVREMRRHRDVHDWFMTTIVPKVCGRKKFSLRGIKPVSEWLTVSSEAYAMLLYEHHHDQCVAGAVLSPRVRRRKQGPAWSDEGRQRLAQIMAVVEQQRRDHKDTDECFFKREKETRSRKRTREVIRAERESGWETVKDDEMSLGECEKGPAKAVDGVTVGFRQKLLL